MRIAVIGAGISGLYAAYRLRHSHAVTLFEANDSLGGHANTVDVHLGDERHAIDTGFIVYNERTYPRFTELLRELGVATRPTSMSFSVRCDRTGLEYNGSSLSGLFVQRSNLLRPSFYRMLRDIVRFHREASPAQAPGEPSQADERLSVREFLARGNYSREFAEHYFLPMGSAIWSCPRETFGNFPFEFVRVFFANHGLLGLNDRPTWRVVDGGSRQYVNAIAERIAGTARVRLQTPVHSVRRHAEFVEITPRGGSPERFDHVVFACHSDQALRMLADPTRTERELLGAFPYERNTALLHTDASVLPRRRGAWASWNYRIRSRETPQAAVTYCMNILQHIRSRHVFNVTLNGERFVDPARILKRFVYEHPIFTRNRLAAQARHQELINSNRSSYCGAYWRNGFHEDGVVSALAVCRALADERAEARAPAVRAAIGDRRLLAPVSAR